MVLDSYFMKEADMIPNPQTPTDSSEASQSADARMAPLKRGPKGGPRLCKSQRRAQLLLQTLEQAKVLKLELEKSKKEEIEELHAANLKVIKDAGLLDLDTAQWRKHIAKVKAVFE